MKKRKGFTLIELLVVILIILILAGILFPVFAGVKNRAHQTKCATHMRQIGMAISMYAADHDDLPPQGGYDSKVAPTFPIPTAQQNPPPPATPTSWRIDWEDILIGMAYVKSYEVFACPSAPTNDYRYSYGVNRWVMGWYQSYKLDSVPYPSNTALISEKVGYDWPIWLPSERNNNPYFMPMDPRHSNQLNVLFVDGHVKRVGVGELIEGGNILWKFQ